MISVGPNEGDGVVQAAVIRLLAKATIIVDRHQKHRLVAQGKEVGAFPHGAGPHRFVAVSVTSIEGMHVLPVNKVRRSIEQSRTPDSSDPGTDQLIPGSSFLPHSMVAERKQIQVLRRCSNHWIPPILLPGDQVIRTGGQAR